MGAMGEHGAALERLGYRLVPERRRMPIWKGWNEGTYTYRPEHDDLDIGVVCGVGDTPVYAIDVDSNDAPFSQWLESWLREHAGWDDVPVRVGRPPRFAMLVSGSMLGLRSAVSHLYKFPDTGNEVRVEFLGTGRKLTVYGTHAYTGRPYTWRSGLAPHQGRAAMTLPEVDQGFVSAMLEAAQEWLEKAGAQVVGMGNDSGRFASAGDGPSMAGLAPRQGLTLARAVQALGAIDLGDRDTWVRVGMAMHHEFEASDEGFDAWHDRSAQCAGYKGERDCRIVWDSFGERDRPPITARYLLARERDALSPRVAQSVPKVPEPNPPQEMVPKSERPLRFIPFEPDYLARSQREIEWLVRSVLPRKSLAVAFGPSGAGKTFVVLDLALRLAAGMDWRGNRSNQGQVLWIAAEGQGGIGARLAAWSEHYGVGLKGLPLLSVLQAPNLLLADWQEIVRTMGEGTALVVFDTLLASSAGANENASEDMGAIIGSARQIIEATGASVLLVHHSGKDTSKGARGHSSLRAAVDVELELTREPGAAIGQVTLSKARDAADGVRWWYELAHVDLGVDREGYAIGSRVAIEADEPSSGPAPDPSTLPPHAKWQKAVWSACQTVADENGKCVWADVVAAASAVMHPRDPDSKDTSRNTAPQHAKRGAEALEQRGWLRIFMRANGSIESVVVKDTELLL